MGNSIDLHIHSTASDGTLTPRETAQLAENSGLCAAALTDHDTVSGLDDFVGECRKIGIEPVPGVEISAKFRCEMHIVGLFVDYHNEEFIKKLSKLKNGREERNIAMIEKLQKGGFDISIDDIAGTDGIKSKGRAHIAAELVKKGYVRDIGEAFDKYLSKGCDYYINRITYPPKESIEMIKDAGGIAVLAHPIYITEDEKELRDLLITLKEYGLDAVECYYSQYTRDYMKLCEKLCRELSLLPSGGSDFHGANKPGINIGSVCGNMQINYKILEDLKKKLK